MRLVDQVFQRPDIGAFWHAPILVRINRLLLASNAPRDTTLKWVVSRGALLRRVSIYLAFEIGGLGHSQLRRQRLSSWSWDLRKLSDYVACCALDAPLRAFLKLSHQKSSGQRQKGIPVDNP
jgi:hypothetical protein